MNITGCISRLFAPQFDSSDVAASVGARDTIESATEEIKELSASLPRLNKELATARAHLDKAREQLDLAGPAADRLRLAEEADAEVRKQRARLGDFGADAVLGDAIDRAHRDLREAKAAEDAASAVLPELEERVREAEDAVKEATANIDEAIWRKRIAELELERPEIESAARLLVEWNRRVAALADAGVRWKLYGTPHGTVPQQILEAGVIPTTFAENELRPLVQSEAEYLKRMRSDPVAQQC